MRGPDHTSSLSPAELNDYIKKIRLFENSIGKYEKKPYKSELKNLNIEKTDCCKKENNHRSKIFTF